MNLLDVQNLTIKLCQSPQKRLVESSHFMIAEGETLALVGESGSGKSLTALAILQLLGKQFNTSGNIIFQDRELCGASEHIMQMQRGKNISMIFQEPMTALNPLHTIGKQIGEAITIHQPNTAHLQSRITELLDQVGLSHFKERLDAYPHQLSGGERQRVMIAMAIANHPKLLIADEPTTAVDVHVQQHILELLAKLKRELGMSMLFITHDLPLVARIADKVAVMQSGVIVEQGFVGDVFNHPKHPYTQKLLASKPSGSAVAIAPQTKTLLSAEHISVKFPIKRGIFARTVGHNTALDDVSLTLKQGETLGVVGESGSGKTTLAFALLKMQPCSGSIVFAGNALHTLDKKQIRHLRQDMQMVFQDPFSSLNPRMTIGDIVGEGLTTDVTKSISSAGIKEAVQRILLKVGLSADMADRYPHEFSGGQRQRISIARAMILEPKLVILDEPTSALDLTVQTQILDLLKQFQAELGISYIFISHDLRVIRAIAHRIIVLRHGKMVESGSVDEVFAQPNDDYTKRLIDAAMMG